MDDHQRQIDGERRAVTKTRADGGDPSAVHLRQLLRDGQAETESPVVSRHRGVLLSESIEDMRQELRRYSAARVAYDDLDVRIDTLQADLHFAAAIRELDGIVQQIPDDLQQSLTVAGDPDRLQQVAWNLLSNAIKFTPEGGTVGVQLRRAGAHVEIEITDSGDGISPEFLPHVFERFRQGDTGSRRRYGGLGLGLAIVRHIVELHGGTVTAESGGQGQGSTFRVLLPIAVTEPVAV